MARPSRIEFPGAVYHISSRCEPGHSAFADDVDRRALIDLMAQAMQRFDAQVLAYCLLHDHYHLVLYTRGANLSRLMRHLNGVYTQHYNRRHGGSGELFHGRFKALLVDRETCLLDACRYVELNPLRLGWVKTPDQWPWSSYRAHAGLDSVPDWLEAEGLWRFVAGRVLNSPAERRRAAQRYASWLAAEPDFQLWPGRVQRQIFLGDQDFARRMLAQHQGVGQGRSRRADSGKGRRQDWSYWLKRSNSREQAIYLAHTEGAQTMSALALQLGLSVSRVSRLVALYERSLSPVVQA
ncbi:transposase [Roseateles sp.]|uniref:transposase n=1 Tax=Roseateles sp. TaxID=1971397 RepID=UPI003BA80360